MTTCERAPGGFTLIEMVIVLGVFSPVAAFGDQGRLVLNVAGGRDVARGVVVQPDGGVVVVLRGVGVGGRCVHAALIPRDEAVASPAGARYGRRGLRPER